MPAADLTGLATALGPAGVNATVKEFVAAEAEFHRRIAAGSGNPVLASLAESMSMPTMRARLWHRTTEPGTLERTLAEHRAIYGAIAGRDADLARSWATAHLGGIEARLRAALSG
jgi:DNA-binding FadR family transcriptional regulator